MEKIYVFADGACLNNGKENAKGGYGLVIADKNFKKIEEDFGKIRVGLQTNNRAELEAMLVALLWINANKKENCHYTIISDSEITVGGMIGSSKREGNRDIWEQVETISAHLLGFFDVEHIDSDKKDKENPANILNNRADKLARQGANSLVKAPLVVNIKEALYE